MHSEGIFSFKQKILLVFVLTSVYLIGLFCFFPAPSAGTLRLDAKPDKVIMVLPFRDANSTVRQLNASPQTGKSRQDVVSTALAAYEAFIRHGNARYLDIAEKLLANWSDVIQPPETVWLLRSRIKQAKHHFNEAASELESLLQRHPKNAHATLLAADARRRAGQLDLAQKHCLSLAGDGFINESTLCLCDIALTMGETTKAARLLEFLELRSKQMPTPIFHWFVVLKADVLKLNNQREEALLVWNRIDDWSSLSYAYKLNLADLLIEQGLYTEMLELLGQERATLAVLLRRNRAPSVRQNQYEVITQALKNRARIIEKAPDNDLHLYERALYASWYEKDHQKALVLGLENWHQQKSYEDAELLLKLAEIADDTSVVEQIRQWQASW